MSDNIQEFKREVGQAAEHIIATGLNLEHKGNKYRCLNRYAHRHSDKNPSMSWDPNALQFLCFGCGMKIDIYSYYKDHLNYSHNEIMREFGLTNDYKGLSMQRNRETFTSQIKELKPISQECIDYIAIRGIAKETVEAFELKTYKDRIAFPYYKLETLVGVKTRLPRKHNKETDGEKMLSVTGSKPYLFNAKNIELGGDLLICEGEFDCMVLWQCGFKNVVSVGAGANSVNSLLDQAKELLDNFDSLIIVSDNDPAGDKMDAMFTEKYGNKVKLIDKKLYKLNDVNEDYIKYGQAQIEKLINSAKLKIEGIRDLEADPYRGVSSNGDYFIPTGIKSIDYALNDLVSGCVTLITGRSNGGKTTFCTQVQANAIDKGFKVFLISGEGKQEELLNNFYTAVIGRKDEYFNSIKVNKRYRKEPKPHILQALQKWHYKKLKLFCKGDSKLKSTAELFQMMALEVKANRHELIIIDNLMSILNMQKASEKLEAQADFIQNCCDFAKAYNVHIIVVLHPNKTYTKGSEMDFEQISGTNDIPNKADNIISVIREYDEDKLREGIDGRIQLIKNRYWSDLLTVNTHYDAETKMLLEIEDETKECIAYNFGFERFLANESGWEDIGRVDDDRD